ncbi:acyltransferase [Hamiltosporidium tvaerminnensis]|uniref:Acyltransferase n=1 Tax=Hamiltosporidium tvaerminnensis TaxID=1176355 RepID=A0A4Q9L9T6_9MICR|nr:hypothetical protein LUQ84_000416 [Hamiltosporidium tvaerminnensis]TBU04216.1 acyltransferase [Hamiltosporidium tvaerminnensis]
MKRRYNNVEKTFLHDAVDYISMGSRSLKRDEFTRSFEPISPCDMKPSDVFYIFIFIIRYYLLFPIRLTLFILGTLLFIFLFLFALIFKEEGVMESGFLFYSKVFVKSFGAKVTHHGNKNRLDYPHVFVANHTSFLDFLVLSSHKFCHACVSESHGGLFGFLFKVILFKNGSVLFKRSEKQDREKVLKIMKNHIKRNKAPLLIFPEGTCVNNKYTVLFQKGAFELGVPVCPVAIKYNRSLMDPYWNRRKHSFTEHLFYLMSRWRLEADVYWLEPMSKLEDESVHEFSERVKRKISEVAGLESVIWNGYFKNSPIMKDREILREAYRQAYLKYVVHWKNDDSESFKYLEKYKSADEKNDYDHDLDKQQNILYFGKFTYKEYLNIVLIEYIKLKSSKTDHFESMVLKGDCVRDKWWGYEYRNSGNFSKCKCYMKKMIRVENNSSKSSGII